MDRWVLRVHAGTVDLHQSDFAAIVILEKGDKRSHGITGLILRSVRLGPGFIARQLIDATRPRKRGNFSSLQLNCSEPLVAPLQVLSIGSQVLGAWNVD